MGKKYLLAKQTTIQRTGPKYKAQQKIRKKLKLKHKKIK